MAKIKESLLRELDITEAERQQIRDIDPEVFQAALSKIVTDPELRTRLEENPADTITKELGLPLSKAKVELLAGNKLSDVSPFKEREGLGPEALGPAAIAVAGVCIFAGPIVVAGTIIFHEKEPE